MVTEEVKPYQDETENKTAISGTKNLKPATKTGSGVNSSSGTPTRKSKLSVRSTSSNQRNELP